ncbi:hypothetical protein [uncultured Intestinimonas sp.]|uniref:hypothetical protein n=1 Tax=uncultured Intestinimonas sp. TaxID=1689265 RepID=UPI002941D7FA|nr:hypothetical protein [uncultured Intestinimonas sp.]
MAEIVLYFALWLAGGLVLQLLLLRLTRNRFRFLRVLPLAVVGWQGFNALRAYGAGGLFIGLNALASLVFLLQGEPSWRAGDWPGSSGGGGAGTAEGPLPRHGAGRGNGCFAPLSMTQRGGRTHRCAPTDHTLTGV